MPVGRFLKTNKKSREFRNKSRSRSKEITMYVGAIDDLDESREREPKQILITPVKDSDFNYRNASKEDSSKIVISATGAAGLNLSINDNPWDRDETIHHG